MKIIRTRQELQAFVKQEKELNHEIGLVPTMGALHEGHISLVQRAITDGATVIVSVFVNPTQFNNPRDLATYPRNEARDFELLEKAGVACVFAPEAEEIYPNGPSSVRNNFQLGRVAEVMEGKQRPGHFMGVAQIVNLLFSLTQPRKAYFGEKDFQQIAVIKQMVASEQLPVEIVSCPIKRSDDGLALSSRNLLLTPAQRNTAPGIYKALKESVEYAESHNVEQTKEFVINRVNALDECRVEYFEIVDALTLESLNDWSDATNGARGCITVHCGNVRLIDNIGYNQPNITQ